MKNQLNFSLLLAGLLVFIAVFLSCKTHKLIRIANTEMESSFNESYEQWHKLKKDHNNSYEYKVQFSSWVGYRSTTTIVVENGKVKSRTFSETKMDDKNRFTGGEVVLYTESESELNTNEKGFKGVTIDQVYQDCGTKSLQMDEGENYLYFTVDDAGIVQSCGHGLKNCADDCSQGVYIANFKWLD